MSFDGSGDEGRIGSVEAYGDGDVEMKLPETQMTLKTIASRWSDNPGQVNEYTLGMVSDRYDGAIETVCYDYLEQTHDGWEISDGQADGADGTFTFDVAEKTIHLDFNQRYIAYENYEHEF